MTGISPVLVVVVALFVYAGFSVLRWRSERSGTAQETEDALDEADRSQP